MKNETERLKLRQKYRDEVNPILAEKNVPKDTYTFTDDYVFWLEEQLVKNIEVIPCCESDSEQLVCDNCYDTDGFYLGTTCPKCKQPFRSVKAN
jgi:hypothetical protein